MNEVKMTMKTAKDGEGGTAAARENDEISRKDAQIRRLIESRRSTPKEEKQRVTELSRSIKKMYQREEKNEKRTRNPKESRRLQRSQQHPWNQIRKKESVHYKRIERKRRNLYIT